jgi:hypothetical protein
MPLEPVEALEQIGADSRGVLKGSSSMISM